MKYKVTIPFVYPVQHKECELEAESGRRYVRVCSWWCRECDEVLHKEDIDSHEAKHLSKERHPSRQSES